ncbi:MAG: MBL fold metallo-hydrolase [Magnetovibrio sp.]|nr:MBL fold metallo-hydrolase [Magnetovibrio sp.]
MSAGCAVLVMVANGVDGHAGDVVHLNNPQLETVKPGYPGNPFQEGAFAGEYTSEGASSTVKFVKWKLTANPKKAIKDAENFTMKVVKHDRLPQMDQPYLMWLGHATVLLNIHGKTVLIDPVLTSPRMMHSERLSEVPVDLTEVGIDYLLASHGHRDHLDEESVRSLQGAPIQAYLPLNMGGLVEDWNTNLEIQEAGWYQKYQTSGPIELYFLPAYHWHRRSMFDLNTVLWGSYLIKYDGVTIYFAGDSGYGAHFKEIGELFGGIDYAVLPIGAYDPAFMMGNNLMTPEQAVQAFKDLNAKVMIPVHYGTFDQTDEPLSEPLQRLRRQIKNGIVGKEAVKILKIGEILPL